MTCIYCGLSTVCAGNLQLMTWYIKRHTIQDQTGTKKSLIFHKVLCKVRIWKDSFSQEGYFSKKIKKLMTNGNVRQGKPPRGLHSNYTQGLWNTWTRLLCWANLDSIWLSISILKTNFDNIKYKKKLCTLSAVKSRKKAQQNCLMAFWWNKTAGGFNGNIHMERAA